MIYFVSDQHFFHHNVIKYCSRPYKDIYHMNEDLISRHNSVVGPNDIVHHLGDFTLSRTAVTEILPRLNGIHYMSGAGNHDACHPVMSKNPQKLQNARQRYFDAGFKTIELGGTIQVGEFECIMSHFPYLDPNPDFDQRYPQLRLKDEGKILLHGHVHNAWAHKRSPKGTLMINVGVDVHNYRPISLEEIKKIIESNK